MNDARQTKQIEPGYCIFQVGSSWVSSNSDAGQNIEIRAKLVTDSRKISAKSLETLNMRCPDRLNMMSADRLKVEISRNGKQTF